MLLMDEISGTGSAMMACGVMFCYVVGFVDLAGEPDKINDGPVDVVAHPKIPHIHAFGFSRFH